MPSPNEIPLQSRSGSCQTILAIALLVSTSWGLTAAPVLLDSRLQIRHLLNTGRDSFRLVRNPADKTLYYLRISGQLYRVNVASTAGASTSTLVYSASDHKVTSAAGLAFGPDGSIYITSNEEAGNFTVARVTKGTLDPATGKHAWSTLAQTEPYQSRPSRGFNHLMNAVLLSPNGASVFVNIGARTDHGEVQDDDGQFPGVRETGITTILLRLPSNASNLTLPNDREALRQLGYLYAEGLRNTYDLAFSPLGHLFGTENSADRDMADELNWLREGHHYGFPWRMGTQDNPQQFPDYDPSLDKLLPPSFTAVRGGLYKNDPGFPPAPRTFTDPVLSAGPDGDSYRDPLTGEIRDASDDGVRIGTFTPHRSPLGLVFDRKGLLGEGFQGHGFVLSWTQGDPNGDDVAGPFADASEDLLHLDLTLKGDGYEGTVTRLAAGFSNPMDAELIDNRLYILEYGGSRGIWEITFPVVPLPLLREPIVTADGKFEVTVVGAEGQRYVLEQSTDGSGWTTVLSVEGSATPMRYSAATEGAARTRFYRARAE